MKATWPTLALISFGIPASAQQAADDCTALRDSVLPGGHVTSARVVPAADPLPAYCEVRATALVGRALGATARLLMLAGVIVFGLGVWLVQSWLSTVL